MKENHCIKTYFKKVARDFVNESCITSQSCKLLNILL